MRYLIYVAFIVLCVVGCTGDGAQTDKATHPFPRTIEIEVRHFDTGEPIEGVEIERAIIFDIRGTMTHSRTSLGVDYTPASGRVVLDINQRGIKILIRHDGFWVTILNRIEGRYQVIGGPVREHDGKIVIPMRVWNKPGPKFPDWLDDKYKLPPLNPEEED